MSNGDKRGRRGSIKFDYAINEVDEYMESAESFATSSVSSSASCVSEIESANKINKNISLSLGGKNLKRLDFLSKFVREFPNVQSIDLAHTKVSNREMQKLTETLKDNRYITELQTKGTSINRETRQFMQEELRKNQ